jgi:hypothetical protein
MTNYIPCTKTTDVPFSNHLKQIRHSSMKKHEMSGFLASALTIKGNKTSGSLGDKNFSSIKKWLTQLPMSHVVFVPY